MHSNNNKNSVFNPDFSFELGNENSIKSVPQKRKLEVKPPAQKNDSDIEDSESKKELDALINNKGNL